MKESISSFLVITAFLLAAGLLSSCSTPPIATYELGAYTLSLPQKNIDANTTAEYQADLVAGQTLQFRFLVTKARIEVFDPQNQVIASKSTSSTTGSEELFFSPIQIKTSGRYRLVVSSLDGTASTVNPLTFFINGNLEQESQPGSGSVTNTSRETAEDLTDAQVTQPGNAHYILQQGTLYYYDASDYYRLLLKTGQKITINKLDTLCSDSSVVFIELQTPDGQTVIYSPDFTAPVDGIYYVVVRLQFNSSTTWVPSWSYGFLVLLDTDLEQEPNNSLAGAQTINQSEPVLGATGMRHNQQLILTNPLPNAYSNDFGVEIGLNTGGALSNSGYYTSLINGYTLKNIINSNDPSQLVLHANGFDTNGSSMGFSTINTKGVSDTREAHAITGQAGSIQIDRVWILADDPKHYGFLFTTLTNLTDAAIPDVVLLDNINPAPGGDTNITGGWEPVPGVHSGALITGNSNGYMGLFSPDANSVVGLMDLGALTPQQFIDAPRFTPTQPGDYSVNIAANIGTLPAHASVTTTQVLVMDASAGNVRALLPEALSNLITLDDYYRVQHVPGIYRADLTLQAYGYTNYVENGNTFSLKNVLDPNLTLYSVDGTQEGTSGTLVDGAVSLVYPVKTTGESILQVGEKLPWKQDGGEYTLRVDPLMKIDQSPAPQKVLLGDRAEFSTVISGSQTPQIQWQVLPPGSTDWSDLEGQTQASLSFTPNLSQNGNQYRAVFTVQGVRVASQPALLELDVIDPPVNLVPPTIGNSAKVGQMVAATSGTWSDSKDKSNPVFTYAYQWQWADDSSGTNLIEIPGATNYVYLPTQVGWLRVKVTATDNGIPGSASTDAYSDWLFVDKGDQVITFYSPSNRSYGQPDFTVAPTSSSGLEVILTASGTCQGNGFTVQITGIGSCTLTATQAGDDNYNPASPVTRSFFITKGTATLSLSRLVQTYDSSTKTVTVTTQPANLNGVKITYDGETTPPTEVGSYTVLASLSNDTYQAAEISGTLTIQKADQTITFPEIANKTYLDPDFTVSATSSSGLAVQFTARGNCQMKSSKVHLTGAGSCTLIASQSGDSHYNPSLPVDQTFTIAKASQTITFGSIPDQTLGSADFALTANASSGLSVRYSASGSCQITESNHVHLKGGGNCTITARQSGNENYLPAQYVPQSFQVIEEPPSYNIFLPVTIKSP